jgi:glycosyltransferase involved in cell wall biosynthesis
VPHTVVEQLMCAADIYVSASHRESSGFALIEALACGLPPVLSDIPSFRSLSGDGAVGQLWPCGDAAALARALVAEWRRNSPLERQRVRAYFEQSASSAALGRALLQAYTALVARQRAGSVP